MIFLICSISSISICDAGSHDSVAGVNPFDIIDYLGYLVDDFYYTSILMMTANILTFILVQK